MSHRLAAQHRALRDAIVASDGDAGPLLRARAGAESLLRIYRHAYTARLVAALRDNFGCLPQVMGDDAFDQLALAYVAAHPSRHPSIRWFGDRLVEFMGGHDHLVPHPALVDLARMEWALRSAFDAADATPIAAPSLTAIPADEWPRLVFQPLPSVQLLDLQWSVEPVWRAMQAAQRGDEPELPEPQPEPHALLIWRAGLENRWRVVDAAQAMLLRAVLDGRDFSELGALAAAQSGESAAAATVVAALQSWLADGLLAGVRCSDRRPLPSPPR